MNLRSIHPIAILYIALFGVLPLGFSAPTHFTKAHAHDKNQEWEQAYHAYRASVEKGEDVNIKERYRAVDRAFLIATDHLGWFDEAVAFAEEYLGENRDGYLHRLLGYFYKKKLRDYDTAREHFERSYEDFLEDERYFAALYSLEQQAGCYRTQLYNMEYYANRKHRESYTKRAERILLKGMPLIDKVQSDNDRRRIYVKYLDSLAYIYGHKWYSGYDPDKVSEYEAIIDGSRQGPKSEYQQYHDQYSVLFDQDRWTEAAALWQDYADKHPNSTNNLKFMERLTKCYSFAKDWENTLRSAEQTMNLVENTIEDMLTDIEKSVAMERGWLANYERAIQAAQKLKRDDVVFDVMERSRARAMLQLLGSRDYSKREARMTDDEKELAFLSARRDEIREAIERERNIGGEGELASLQRSLVIVEDTSEKIRRRVDIARRELLSSSEIDPISATEAQELIGDHTLISIFAGIHISVITRDKVTSRYIRGSSYFEKLIRNFRKAIDAQADHARALVFEPDGDIPPDADDRIIEVAQELHRIIIKPVEKYFSTKSDKVFIVYDRWHPLVPYQLLHDGEQFMAEKYALVYAPSVSVLQHCMERRQPAGKELLALGNPNLLNPEYDLVYAEEEVLKLSDIYPSSRVFTGNDATETAVQLFSSDADILHFACHGVIDEEDPMASHLRLSPDKNGDGFLTADDIMDLHLQSSLVTLSACDTGRGRILMGGEILGLTRAWMYAGTSSVLASLWKVDDRATSRLMTSFYENLKTHDKAKSLQLAQLELIKEGLSPFYWAAFCLYGNDQ